MSYESGELATPMDFASELFASNNEELFIEYINSRVKGFPAQLVFRGVFGEEYNDTFYMARVYAIENNAWVKKRFKKAIEDVKVGEAWNPKVALFELLSLVRSPYVKDATRIASIKELNVLAGITIMDSEGRSKAVRGMDDFYNEADARKLKEVAAAAEHAIPGVTATFDDPMLH